MMAGNLGVPIIPPSELCPSDSWLPSYSMGSFSNMHASRWNMSRVTVRDGEEGLLNRELDILASLTHPSLLLLMGQCLATKETDFRLVFEPIFLGSLYFCLHIQIHDPALWVDQFGRVDIMLQVTDGLLFLAERDLVHMAVTSHAVQLTRHGVAKLGQLELTVHEGAIVRRPTDTGFKILYNWLSPEVLGWDHAEARFTSDVYSLCCVIWELYTGEVPWGDCGAAEIVHLVKMGNTFAWKRNNLPHLLNIMMKQGVQERTLGLLGVRDLLVSIGTPEGQINTQLIRLEVPGEADFNMSSMQVMELGVNFAKFNSLESDSVITQELQILPAKDVQPVPAEYVLPLHVEVVQPVPVEDLYPDPAEDLQPVLEEDSSPFIELYPGHSPSATDISLTTAAEGQVERLDLKVSAVFQGPESGNSDQFFPKMYGCASCGKKFSTYQALGGHTSVHSAQAFVPKPVPAEASDGVLTVRQVMDDSRMSFFHPGIGKHGVKLIREHYRSLASYKRKSFADSDAFLFLSVSDISHTLSSGSQRSVLPLDMMASLPSGLEHAPPPPNLTSQSVIQKPHSISSPSSESHDLQYEFFCQGMPGVIEGQQGGGGGQGGGPTQPQLPHHVNAPDILQTESGPPAMTSVPGSDRNLYMETGELMEEDAVQFEMSGKGEQNSAVATSEQNDDEDANMPSNAKLESEYVRNGRKRGHYKSFGELGLKQRKRRTDELFLSLKRTANKNNVSPLIISAELTRRLEAAQHTDHEKWALDVLSGQDHDETDTLNLSLFFKTQVGGRRKYNRLKNALSKKRRASILPHHRMIAHRNVVLPKIYKIKNSEKCTIGVMSTLKETMRKFYSRLLNKIGYSGSGYLKGSLKVSSDSAVHKKFNQLSGKKDFIEVGVEEVNKADLARPSEFQNLSICKLQTVPEEDVQQVPAEDVQPVPARVLDTQYAEGLGIGSKGKSSLCNLTKKEFGSCEDPDIMEEQLDMINLEMENSERELDWEYQLLRNFGVSSLGSFLSKLSETVKTASEKKGDSWCVFYQETIPGYFGKLLSWLISTTDHLTDCQIVDLYSNLEIYVNSYCLSPLSDDDCWHDLIAVLTEAFLVLNCKNVEKLGSSIFRHSIADLCELEQVLLGILKQIGINKIIVEYLSWKLRTMEGGKFMLGAVIMVIKLLPCTEYGDVLAAATEVMDELEVDHKICAALDILNCAEVLESNDTEHLLIGRTVQSIEYYMSRKTLTLYQNVSNFERFVERLPPLSSWQPEIQHEPDSLVKKLTTFPVHVPMPVNDVSFQNIEIDKKVVSFIPERPSILEILQDLDTVHLENDDRLSASTVATSEDVKTSSQVSQCTYDRINSIGDSWETNNFMETSETVSSHLEQQMYISQPNQTRESLEGISEPLQVRVAPGLQSPPPSLPLHQPPSLLSVQVPPPDHPALHQYPAEAHSEADDYDRRDGDVKDGPPPQVVRPVPLPSPGRDIAGEESKARGGGCRRDNEDPYESRDDSDSGDGVSYGQNRSRRTVSFGARSGHHRPASVMESNFRSSSDREESTRRCEGRIEDDRRQEIGGEKDKEHMSYFDSKEERRQRDREEEEERRFYREYCTRPTQRELYEEEKAPHGPSRPGSRVGSVSDFGGDQDTRNKSSQLAMLQQQALQDQQYLQQQQMMAVNPLQFQVQFMLLSLGMTLHNLITCKISFLSFTPTLSLCLKLIARIW